MSTIFDENSKIWYGWRRDEDSTLDDNISVGEWCWRVLRNKSSNEICQISDTEEPEPTHLSYQQTLSNAIRLAKQMRKWQLTCYDIIGIVATNSKYQMQIILAAWFNGLAFHAINPGETEAEAIHYLLSKTKPKVIFCDGLYWDKLQNSIQMLYPIVCTLSNHIDKNFDVIRIEDILGSDDEEDEESFCTEPLRDGCDQTMAILCTSGTIGLPKCVRITNKMCLTDYGLLSEKSLRVFSFCNIDWIFGFYGLLSNILYGNQRIITTQPYSPEYLSNLISTHKINCLLATPTQISHSLNNKPESLESLKFVILTGTSCSKANLQQMRSTLKQATVINLYGTSECGGIAANFGDYKTKSVGQLFANVDLKIVDEATGEKMGPYEIGVICVKNKFHNEDLGGGYYGDVGAFYKILDSDDFIVTGDLGFMDTEHYLYLADRREIVLQYHNFYYSPSEFEILVAELKGVRDVCVVGIPKQGKGDIPACMVVKEVSSDLRARDVMNYVNLRKNSLYNCFDYGVFFVEEIPRNHKGKVMIKEVVEMCRSLKKKEKRLTL